MIRSRAHVLVLILVCVFVNVVLIACAGVEPIPDSEKKFVEGVIVEGGVNGFRLKDGSGEVLRFITHDHISFEPADFHAFFGDQVGVSYYTIVKRGREMHKALSVKLLAKDPDRIDLSAGFVEGIVRASGMLRYLVHLPEKGVTVAFYKDDQIKYSPQHWIPRPGSQVRVIFTSLDKRYYKRFRCAEIFRLGEDRVKFEDRNVSGVVTEILANRNKDMIPDRFVFKPDNGDAMTINTGGETIRNPMELQMIEGRRYQIRYYALLMGDFSQRRVATLISQ